MKITIATEPTAEKPYLAVYEGGLVAGRWHTLDGLAGWLRRSRASLEANVEALEEEQEALEEEIQALGSALEEAERMMEE